MKKLYKRIEKYFLGNFLSSNPDFLTKRQMQTLLSLSLILLLNVFFLSISNIVLKLSFWIHVAHFTAMFTMVFMLFTMRRSKTGRLPRFLFGFMTVTISTCVNIFIHGSFNSLVAISIMSWIFLLFFVLDRKVVIGTSLFYLGQIAIMVCNDIYGWGLFDFGYEHDVEKQLNDPISYIAFPFIAITLGLQYLKTQERTVEIIDAQNQKLQENNSMLEKAYSDLKSTQAQLIQQEKLASLGQLTAGIAHEIKNPLNFVTNFSELSVELIDELRDELQNKNFNEADAIVDDIKSNLSKIHNHGTRADSIVKAMLQHSRGSDGKMEPTDLNTLVKEYVNLSFHGMRAGKNPINVDLEFDLDETVGKVNLVGEDFSRVVINVASNSFDAMREKLKVSGKEYPAKLSVRTRREKENVILEIEDNGPGIPDSIKDKILQPFFTTKKGTEGTGLGLSITSDIIKAHGGTLEIQSVPDHKTVFIITIKS